MSFEGWYRRGITKAKFVPTIAATTVDEDGNEIVGNPTDVELQAGQDLQDQIADIAGFQLNNASIPTPSLGSRFTTQIPGEDTVDASSLTFYDDKADDTVRTALAKGTVGYIVFAHQGWTAGNRLSVFPVRSSGDNDELSVGNDPARFVVGFAITAPPNLDAEAPASV